MLTDGRKFRIICQTADIAGLFLFHIVTAKAIRSGMEGYFSVPFRMAFLLW